MFLRTQVSNFTH